MTAAHLPAKPQRCLSVLLAAACLALAAQSASAQSASAQPAEVAPTLSLGEAERTVKLEIYDPETKFQNGFFSKVGTHGHVTLLNKDGHITGDLTLHPQEKPTEYPLGAIHDLAIFKDGSIVASWVYMLPHDNRRYFFLVHYDPAGNFLEQIDLGTWRALHVCIADDKSIWTLSGEEQFGHPLYSPDEGVLRNYKFGSGLRRAAVPRSIFPQDNNNAYSMSGALDCSGDKIHALTGDGQWLEYTPGGDFTLTKVEPLAHTEAGDYRMSSFAYLGDGHAYAIMSSVPGYSFPTIFAELLPSKDGTALQWVEIPADHTLPANHQASTAASNPTDKPKPPVTVTELLGVDREDGDRLVYRTSADESVLWSRPTFAGAVSSIPNK